MKWCLLLLVLAVFGVFYTDANQEAKRRVYCRKNSQGLLETNDPRFIDFFKEFQKKCVDPVLSTKTKKNKKTLIQEEWMEETYCKGNLAVTDLDCKKFFCIKDKKYCEKDDDEQ